MYKLSVLAGFFTLVVLLAYACENDPGDIAALQAKLDPNIETAEEVEIIYSDSAKVRVRITGPVMLTHRNPNDPQQEFPKGLKVDFFDLYERPSSMLTSKYAIRMERKGQVLVQDSVVWQSVKGERLETEELIWDEKLQKVYSDKFVVITRPQEIIYGHGFESNQDFTNARINAVEGRIVVDELDEPQENQQQ
ncbi:MAG: LPS export ABC transporter periplasmic protein LptC [Saprospiraceae bacterium]|nr:LPS export ABC transporter periplasmic protein LptC [Saprospiraceae bacterium]